MVDLEGIALYGRNIHSTHNVATGEMVAVTRKAIIGLIREW